MTPGIFLLGCVVSAPLGYFLGQVVGVWLHRRHLGNGR